jgi:hypothetical protein
MEVYMKPETKESKLKKRLDDLHKDIDIMKGDKFRLNEINLDYIKMELFTSEFMEKYTIFSSFDNMITTSGFKIENELEFKDASATAEWNAYVNNNTEFKDWSDMLRTSIFERATRKLTGLTH